MPGAEILSFLIRFLGVSWDRTAFGVNWGGGLPAIPLFSLSFLILLFPLPHSLGHNDVGKEFTACSWRPPSRGMARPGLSGRK